MQPSNRAAAILLGIVTTILLGWVLKVGAGILQPIVIALLLASMLSPLVRGLARFGIPPLVSVLGMVSLLGFGVFQAVVTAQANIEAFLRDTPSAVRQYQEQQLDPSSAERAGDSGSPPSEASLQPDEAPSSTGLAPSEQLGAQASPDPSDPHLADGGDPSVPDPLLPDVEQEAPSSVADPVDEPVIDRGLGVFDQLQNEQAEAIQQAGGLTGIVDKLIVRVESSSLPAPLIDYLVKELTDLEQEGRAADLASQFLGGGLSVVRTLILVLIYMLFIFAEQAVFRRKILAVAGERREQAASILDTIGRGIQQFLGIKTLISIATAALVYSVLVSLRIPYALLFAFTTFLLNFIPYFGSLLAGALPTITAVAIEPSIDKAAVVAITYLTVNVVLGSYVEPKIMGRELDLSPLVIIISVVVWGSLWGVVGAFLAVPLMATAQIVLAASDSTRPIAVMLSSGPPREPRRGLRRAA